MKLHLPVTLLTALMAVLSTHSVDAAQEMKVNEQAVSNWDGTLSKDDETAKPYIQTDEEGNIWIDDGVEIYVWKAEGDQVNPEITIGEAGKPALQLRGNSVVNVGKDSTVTVHQAEIGVGAQGDNPVKTEITVDGGTFKMDGGEQSTLGEAKVQYSKTDVTILVENGGTFEAGEDTRIGYLGAKYTETSLSITVTGNGSTFSTEGSISYIGKDAAAWGGRADQTLTIQVEDGATFIFGGSFLGTYGSSSCQAAADLRTDIYIKDAEFIFKGDGIIGSEYQQGSISSRTSRHTQITLQGNAVFDLTEATSKARIYGTLVVEGGSIKCNAETIEDILGTNSFDMRIDSGKDYVGVIDVGGLPGSWLTSADAGSAGNIIEYRAMRINNAGTTITGIKAGTTLTMSGCEVICIGLTSARFTDGEAFGDGNRALFEFQEETGSVRFGKGGLHTTTFVLSDDILDVLSKGDGDVGLEIWVTNGEVVSGKNDDFEDIEGIFQIDGGWTVKDCTAQDGKLTLTIDMSKVWFATKHDDPNHHGTSHAELKDLQDAEKVVIDESTTLHVTEEGGTVKFLEGGSTLSLEGNGEVSFENTDGLSSTYRGKLSAVEDVDIRKTGKGDLTLAGGMDAAGDVTIEEGKLIVTGEDNVISGALRFSEDTGKQGTLQVDSVLRFFGNSDLSAGKGTITGSGWLYVAEGANLELGKGITLGNELSMWVDGNLTLSQSTYGSQITLTGNGVITMGEGSDIGENVQLGENIKFRISEDFPQQVYFYTKDKVTLLDLSGSRYVRATGDVVLEGKGTYSGSLSYNNTVAVRGEYDLSGASIMGSLDNGGADPAQTGAGILIFSEGNEGTKVTNDLVLRKGATTRVKLDFGKDDLWEGDSRDVTVLTASGNIIVEAGTIFEIENLSDVISDNLRKGEKEVFLMKGKHVFSSASHYEGGTDGLSDAGSIGGSLECDTNAEVRLSSEMKWFFKNAQIVFHNNEAAVVASSEEGIALAAEESVPEGPYIAVRVEPRSGEDINKVAGSFNATAGSSLLTHYTEEKLPSEIDPDVLQVISSLGNVIDSNPAETNRIMAAVAGSTLTSLSAAQSAALRNQMGRVRDHALQAGRLRCMGNDEATAQQRPCKNSHVWVEGTSFFSEQHSVGDESGYRLNSWGGALGIDAQVDAHWSVGVSLSASYGDLEARAADHAKGDLDTYTVSFWSQAKNGRWGNTLLFTLGTNEADLKRTVNYGAGSYTATSNTSGSSLGAMWEVTYDFHPVKDNKSNILQPLFNVALTRTSMDGFSEKNAGNVGLTTEKQTRDTVTLGLGLRWLAAINSAKAVNRTVSTEVHANVAQDMGDRRSVANVALLADPSYTQNVYGSKAGSTAFQFGAGVNVPMTPNSQIYVNAGGELREHANAWNAALGIRMGF